jgi:hypothetical protein
MKSLVSLYYYLANSSFKFKYFSDSSLDDIKYVLNPTFDKELIKNLDLSSKLSRAIDGTMYLPGIVGLNNIKENDYCNVVLQVNWKHYSHLPVC